MKEVTKTYKVFTFDELDDKAQDTALNTLAESNVDYDWWDATYDDAKNIGLEITSFDLGRGRDIEGKFTMSPTSVAKKIIEDHGKDTETAKDAQRFLTDVAALKVDEETGEIEDEDELEDLENEFKRTLLEDYLSMLGGEYDYLTSREGVIDFIEANDFEFTEDGSIFHG